VISRRHLHLLIALLLPLMVMRGMLPAGYMAVAEEGKLRIVMCSAGLTLPGDADPGTDDSRSSDPGTCLFAHATSVAPPVLAVVGIAPTHTPVQLVSLESGSLPPATGPPRLAAARAPPAVRI
jgi:hypothetical protein